MEFNVELKNSSDHKFALDQWLYFKGKRKGDMLELYLTPLSEIPNKEINPEQQTSYTNLVNQIISITKDSDYLKAPEKQARVKILEKQIDQLVYKLYDPRRDSHR